VVHWKKVRKKDIIQYKRCQQLEHAAANCNLKYRCVKCKEDHESDKCTICTDKNYELYCYYSFGHPVSYRRCSKIKNSITNKTRIDKEKKIAKINNLVNPYLSYAEVIKT